MARQISEGARDIDALVGSMNQGHLAMHDSATGIWAEMSQPGTAPDPATAMRLARQAVVMAARIGVATEDARTRCNHVVRLMNQVIAEGHVLCGHGRETERRAAELRDAVEQIERAIGEPLAPTAPGASSPSASSSRLVALSQMPGFSSGFAPDASAAHEPALHRAGRVVRSSAARIGRYLVERAAELAGRAERVSTLSQRRFGGRWPFASHQISREAAHHRDAAATDADEDYELPRLYDLPRRPTPPRFADGPDAPSTGRERQDNDTRPRD
jgi:hypothetical protein